MIKAKKNAPSLAVGGKSTFSEGGGDKGCVQKSTTVRNCNGLFVASQQVMVFKCKKLSKMCGERIPACAGMTG
jgi:hypothetical protein